MKISLEGYGENAATFAAEDTVRPGMPVMLTASGTVGPCAAQGEFCGVALSVRGGYAAVQLAGYARLAYSGNTAPAVGYGKLCADGTGGVKPGGERIRLITDVNTADKTCGFLL